MRDEPEIPSSPEIEDDVFGGINLLTRSLSDLDDRGLVLSLAAFAEEALGELLRAFMMPSDATKQLVEGFNAPLGTFSSRIKAAYALGLLTEDQFLDLERLRKIRNEFAHSWKPVSFSKQKVAALIDNMAFSRINGSFPDTLSEKIRSSMSCLLIEIRSSTHQIQKKGMQAKLVGNHLMVGFPGDFESQISSARDELKRIDANLSEAEGKKREFYVTLLLRFKDRLTVMAKPEDAEQAKAFKTFLEEFGDVLRQVSA